MVAHVLLLSPFTTRVHVSVGSLKDKSATMISAVVGAVMPEWISRTTTALQIRPIRCSTSKTQEAVFQVYETGSVFADSKSLTGC